MIWDIAKKAKITTTSVIAEVIITVINYDLQTKLEEK